MPDSATVAILARDYGALGVLLAILLYGGWKLWGELRQVRADSDERAKKHLDQIDQLITSSASASKEHAKTFADATIRQSEIFASAVRELNQAQREITGRLIELADKNEPR